MTELELMRCPSCGTSNRVPREKIEQGLQAVCGRCKAPLSGGSNAGSEARSTEPLHITDANFSVEVERSPVPVLLDMWAPWCGPCRMVAPVIEQLAVEMAGRVRVGKMNVDENPATSDRFAIRSIPSLLVFKGGREVDRIVGVQPKAEIVRRLERVMA